LEPPPDPGRFTDTGNNRIQTFGTDGTYLTQWGGFGTGNSQFKTPVGLAVDPTGNLYVADTGNHRIQEFTTDGTYLTQWGTNGTGDGQFSSPSGVAVDPTGSVYIADGASRIQKFVPAEPSVTIVKVADEDSVVAGTVIHYHLTVTNTGNTPLTGVTLTDDKAPACTGPLPDLPAGANRVVDCTYATTLSDIGTYTNTASVDTNETDTAMSNTMHVTVTTPAPSELPPAFSLEWGSQGHDTGQFDLPRAIAAGPSGHVYVADTSNDRIQEFTAAGTYVRQWGTHGTGNGQFSSPSGVAVDPTGNVYVADTYNDRIQKFTADGTYLAQWGTSGTGDGEFLFPFGVAADRSGNIYVADTFNHRIQKFTADGTYLTRWGTQGGGDGQFRQPRGIAVDGSGNVRVADTYNDRIQEFTADGTYLTQWGTNGTGNGQFSSPSGVTVDPTGNLYVADTDNRRIQKFTADGTYLTQWGTNGTGNGQFRFPAGVAADATGIVVADTDNHRIQRFVPAAAPSVAIAKAADEATVAADESIHYHLTVTNTGNVTLTGVTVTDTKAPACTGPLPDLPAGATRVVDCTYTTTRSDIGTYTNTATVHTNETDTATSDTARVIVTRPVGRIAGTVTESGTGDPLEGTWVIALRTSDYGLAGGALTGADGQYSLPVDVGTYAIEFVDTEFSHIIEWHDGHGYRDIEDADPVSAAAGATTTVDAALQDPTGAVEGIVTEAGIHTPLAGAVVAVLPVGVPRPLAATTTNTDGDFRIDSLPPGDYLVVTAMPQGTHVATFYGGTSDVNAAVPVAVTAGSSSYAFLAPPPVTGAPVVGQVTGNVTDDVTGRPEPGALVGVLRAADFRFTAATFTDQDGDYSLGVGGGDHYLETFDLDTGHRFEWYDDQQTPNEWSELATVFSSSTADAALTPLEGNVAGTVTEAGTGNPLGGIWVALIGYDTGQPVAGTTTDTSGDYTLPAIDIGDYYQVFIDPTGNHALEFHVDTGSMGNATPISVVGGLTANNDTSLEPT